MPISCRVRVLTADFLVCVCLFWLPFLIFFWLFYVFSLLPLTFWLLFVCSGGCYWPSVVLCVEIAAADLLFVFVCSRYCCWPASWCLRVHSSVADPLVVVLCLQIVSADLLVCVFVLLLLTFWFVFILLLLTVWFVFVDSDCCWWPFGLCVLMLLLSSWFVFVCSQCCCWSWWLLFCVFRLFMLIFWFLVLVLPLLTCWFVFVCSDGCYWLSVVLCYQVSTADLQVDVL